MTANDAARNDAQVFNNILNDKVKEGVSNIRRNRYLTYSVTADTAEDAARQLSRIEVESSRILNSIGSKAHLMNGTQRLSVIHSLLNPYKPFLFDYQRDISAKRLQTTKDCIAPTQIDFRPDGHYNDCVKLDNGVYAQVLVMKKFGSELSDRALADMADLPIPMAITWYVQPMDKSKAINYVRTRSAWIDKEIIEEQRSAVNKGYDFSILPQELKYSKEETEDVLDHLQNKNQRLYVFTGLVYTYAESKEALDTQVLRIISTARQNSIELDTYDYRQRQGLNSILPLGHNHVEISRMFTTAQVSILVPFATQELDDAGGNFYGQNKHSRNLVVCNRKKLTSPMGFVCGKTGSGKGMFTKTEMTGTIFSNPTDEIYVIDRAGEYTAIAERYGGITAEKTFTAEDSAGSVTLDYAFDSYDLKGKTLVVYETLTDAKGAKLAEHRDKSDVSQQVTVLTPKLSTSAVGDADNSKSVTAEDDVTVTDYVRYTGLTAGQTYTLTGTLMDKSTKKAFMDADGTPVTATAEFTAEAESGTTTVTFTFDASGIKTGTKLVAFETVATNGIEIADHKDINDIDQTVTVKAPVIGTTAVDAADGDKTVTGEENVAVRDTVHYNNVTPGKTYKVTGTLYEKVLDKNGKVTKKVFKDKNGTPVTAEANFTAEDSYGNVDVTFYFDGSSLKEGTSLVAFESLSHNDKEIASHADVNDSGQTVIITKPKLSTTATDALDGDKNLIGEDNVTIVDTVHYMNVTPGKTYKVSRADRRRREEVY